MIKKTIYSEEISSVPFCFVDYDSFAKRRVRGVPALRTDRENPYARIGMSISRFPRYLEFPNAGERVYATLATTSVDYCRFSRIETSQMLFF